MSDTNLGIDIYRLLDDVSRTSPVVFGDNLDPARDPVHVHVPLTFARRASAIAHWSREVGGLWVYHIALAGTYGPLPDVYCEEILLHRSKADSLETTPAGAGFSAFLDIFHHRLLGLLYRAYRLGPCYSGPHDAFINQALESLCGFSLFPKLKLSHRAIFPNFDRLWANTTSLSGLTRLLSGYFKCHVKADPFQGKWLYPEEVDLSYLGQKHHHLGRDLILGRRVWHAAHGIAITLGPLPWPLYLALVPPQEDRYEELYNLCLYYVGRAQDIQVRLQVDPHQASPCVLGSKNFLGFTTWLMSKQGRVRSASVSFSMAIWRVGNKSLRVAPASCVK